MWPRLRAGDEAELIVGGMRPIREGDVVVARVCDKLVIHRVLALAPDHVRLRADNAADLDPPVSFEEILGVVQRVRRGGSVLEAASWDKRPGALRLLAMRIRERVRLLWGRAL